MYYKVRQLYYKIGQALLQSRSTSHNYKVGKGLLKSRTGSLLKNRAGHFSETRTNEEQSYW